MLTPLLLVLAPLLACDPGEGLFRDITFDEALGAAKKEQKIVMIDFFTTWCGPCKKLDTTTWKDPLVVQWAAKNCVALKVDAEDDVDLAEGFKIASVPTILLLNPDGSEIDRLVGYRDGQTFIADASKIIAGKDSLARAREKVSANENDAMARHQYAKELVRNHRYDEALTEYLRCFDRGHETRGYEGARLSYLLSDLDELGQLHPPAIKAMQARRDAAEARLLSGSESDGDLMDACALNDHLKSTERTIALYDRLRAQRPLSTRQRQLLQDDLLEPLGDAKRYTDLLELIDDPDKYVADSISLLEMSTAMRDVHAETSRDEVATADAQERASIVRRGSILRDALLQAGRTELASKVSQRLAAFATTSTPQRDAVSPWIQPLTIEVAAPSDELFRDLPFDEAVATAKKEQKIVMIDFFTTWCGPCKKLDTTTWKDSAVLEWAAQKCVALKVDAEKDVALAKRFKISAYPTIVLLKEDGSEIDRLVGYRDARTFLSDVASALSGKTSVDRAKEALVGHEQEPMARGRYATELMRKGRFEEALTEYLWCFDHGAKSPGYSGVRRSFLLGDIAQLGRQYPPALKALEERRDAAESRLVAGSESFDDLADASALNENLGASDRTLQLYDRLRKERPLSRSLRSALQRELIAPLAEAKRYADLIELVEDPDAYVKQSIELVEITARFDKEDAGGEENKQASESASAMLRNMVVTESCILHQALLATGRTEVADDVAHRLMVFAPKGSTYTALIASAVKAGAVDTARSIGEIGISVLPEAEQKKVRKALDQLPKSTK